MDLLIRILGPLVVALVAPLIFVPWRALRPWWLERRAAAGRPVVLPARLALHGRRLPPRGALVRSGEDLLWLSRRIFGRSVRLDPSTVAEQGRLVDTSSSAVAWVYRDYPVRAGDGGELRVAEWYGDVLHAMRHNEANPPRRLLVAAAIPRWVLLLPLAAVLGFSPLLLGWSNGHDVTASVVAHDTDYDGCDVTWRATSGVESATVDCELEHVGSTITVRALGFPMSGDAADLTLTPEIIRWGIGLPLLLSALFLTVHLPIALRAPAIELTEAKSEPTRDAPAGTLGHWQERALECARVDGLRPRRGKPGLARRRGARLVETWELVRSGGGWVAWCAAFSLFFAAIFLVFSVPPLWALAHQPAATTTVRVVEAGELQLPFLARDSSVETEDGDRLWLTSWQTFEDGDRVRVVRTGDVVVVPGDPGLQIGAGEGAVTLLVGLGLAHVTWRRIRRALALRPGGSGRGEDEECPFAAFALPDGNSLLVLLDPAGEPDLAIPIRGRVASVGIAEVPRSRQAGDLVVPVVAGRALAPQGRAEELTGADLDDLLDDIA